MAFINRFLVRLVIPVLLLGAAWLSSCGAPQSCPATSLTMVVEASADGGIVPHVEAVILDPDAASGQVDGGGRVGADLLADCMPDPYNNETTCIWSGAGRIDAGSYAIRVAAPGYQTVSVAVDVSFGTGNCKGGLLRPNVVVLTPDPNGAPADGGAGDGGL